MTRVFAEYACWVTIILENSLAMSVLDCSMLAPLIVLPLRPVSGGPESAVCR